MAFKPEIWSEIEPLRAVVVHSPGAELERMWPHNVEAYRIDERSQTIQANPDYLLFDDLVLPRQLAEEHSRLVDVLRAAVGPDGDVVDIAYLWRRALFECRDSSELVSAVVAEEERQYGWKVAVGHRALMTDMDPHRLAETLITGFDPDTKEQVFRWPAPNLLFARDIGAVVGEHLILTRARHGARAREMTVTRWALSHHPALMASPRVSLGGAPPGVALEGGDILVLSPRVIAVGVGHRTTWSALVHLLPPLFDSGIEVAVIALLPPERASMHLDTVFTVVSESECLAYMPAVGMAGSPGTVRAVRLRPGDDLEAPPRSEDKGWLDVLSEEGFDLRPIACGGARPVDQAREQWSDGANAFALAPGKIVCYGRNLRTLDELNRSGFEVLSAAEYCRNARLIMSQTDRRVAVTVDGFELSRGRGGPRCLTFPLLRGVLT